MRCRGLQVQSLPASTVLQKSVYEGLFFLAISAHTGGCGITLPMLHPAADVCPRAVEPNRMSEPHDKAGEMIVTSKRFYRRKEDSH